MGEGGRGEGGRGGGGSPSPPLVGPLLIRSIHLIRSSHVCRMEGERDEREREGREREGGGKRGREGPPSAAREAWQSRRAGDGDGAQSHRALVKYGRRPLTLGLASSFPPPTPPCLYA